MSAYEDGEAYAFAVSKIVDEVNEAPIPLTMHKSVVRKLSSFSWNGTIREHALPQFALCTMYG